MVHAGRLRALDYDPGRLGFDAEELATLLDPGVLVDEAPIK
jgi:hypothetical protein